MQTISSTEQDQQLWQQFVNQANAYDQSRQVFFQQCKDRIKIIREALHNPSQRRVALLFFEYLNEVLFKKMTRFVMSDSSKYGN